MASPSFKWFKAGGKLAAFSFTLYLVHYPLLNFAAVVSGHRRVATPTLAHWAVWLGIVLAACAFAYGVYWLFERRTPAVRNRLVAVLHRPGPSGAVRSA